MPGFCNTLPNIVIIGGIFIVVGIVLLAVGGSSNSFFCGATCDAICPNNNFYTNADGDYRCSNCIYYNGACETITVTKQMYAVYSSLTAIGALMLGFAVLISFVKLLKLLQKVTIDTSKKNNVTLILFFVLLVLGVMFFVIRFNAPGIACQSVCDPECATRGSSRYRTLGWYAVVEFDGKDVDCSTCFYSSSGSCTTLSATTEAVVVAQAGLGLGIPFTVLGGIFGVIWLIRAVVMPTKSGATTAKPKSTTQA